MATQTATHRAHMTRPEHTEGLVVRTIEQQTAKLPSDLFLWAAGGSIIGSLGLQCWGGRRRASFRRAVGGRAS